MLLKNLRALLSQKGQNDSLQYKAARNAPKQDRSFQKVVGSVQKDSVVPLSLQNKWINQPTKQTKEIRHFQNKHTHTYLHLAVNTKIWAKHSTIGTGLKERVTSLLQDFLFTVLGSFPQITRSTGQVLQLLWKWAIDFLFSLKILSFFYPWCVLLLFVWSLLSCTGMNREEICAYSLLGNCWCWEISIPKRRREGNA